MLYHNRLFAFVSTVGEQVAGVELSPRHRAEENKATLIFFATGRALYRLKVERRVVCRPAEASFWLAISGTSLNNFFHAELFIVVSLPSNPTPASPPKSPFSADDTCDADWFNREVYPHDGRLKAYLRGSFPSVRDVDDVVQQSYLRIWRRQLLRPLESVQSFLYSVARNLAIDTLRRETRSPVQPVPDLTRIDVLDSSADAAETACTNEELDLLMEAIDSLPKRCREVVVLRKLFGMPPPEIARKLGISEGTVHVQGAKGVCRCEEFLRLRGIKVT